MTIHMKKKYLNPTIAVLSIASSLPLVTSDPQQPTIGNGYDKNGAQEQFSQKTDWSNSWNQD